MAECEVQEESAFRGLEGQLKTVDLEATTEDIRTGMVDTGRAGGKEL